MSVVSTNSVWNTITVSTGQFIRNQLTPLVLPIVENNIIPDVLLRMAIRQEIEMELAKIAKLTAEEKMKTLQEFIKELKAMPIAVQQTKANEQHYEIPDEFYQLVLGPQLKYSSCLFEKADSTLEQAEIAMLELYCERAELFDGMKLIDVGCGWGSVTLYMAQKYPKAEITAISNSNTQREYILGIAAKRGLKNVTVYTGDIVTYDLPKEKYYGQADRIISIEMFEHMKNYQLLLRKISNWMKPKAKLFIHIFTHREVPGHYKDGWMTENFFTGGTLPSDNLLLYFQDDVKIINQWRVNGAHYQKTLEAWLKIMDSKKEQVLPILAKTYGENQALKRYVYWRLFFIGCAEFFGIRNGEEYLVSHYLFEKP